MKKWIPTLLVFLLVLGRNNFYSLAVDSEDCSNLPIADKIICLEKQLNQLSGKSKTLAQDISKRKTQIGLTTAQIAKTQQEIDILSSKIGRLEVSLDQLAIIIGKRIAATYKVGDIDPVSLFFSSRNFSDFTDRYKYLKVIQTHDKKLMYAMETTRTNYDEQKQVVQALKKKLESQKAALAQQQKDMEFLLTETKNQEKIYQEKLNQALAELSAAKMAMSEAVTLLKDGKGDPVTKGQTIGLVGNSGYPNCSTGAHLHFMVLKDGVVQNPANYLKSTSVIWNNSPDSSFDFTGSWDWPVSNPRITQGYGMTYWARGGYYGGAPHNGLDMTSDNSIIKSPADGKIIRSSMVCGKSTLKYLAVGHDNGLISIYLHVQ